MADEDESDNDNAAIIRILSLQCRTCWLALHRSGWELFSSWDCAPLSDGLKTRAPPKYIFPFMQSSYAYVRVNKNERYDSKSMIAGCRGE